MEHKNLAAWSKSIDLVTNVYSKTKKFPQSEKFGLVNQMRKCAVSIPSNIAEGSARNSTKDYLKFLYISLGSATELDTQVIICEKLGLMKSNEKIELTGKLGEVIRLLHGLIKRNKLLLLKI